MVVSPSVECFFVRGSRSRSRSNISSSRSNINPTKSNNTCTSRAAGRTPSSALSSHINFISLIMTSSSSSSLTRTRTRTRTRRIQIDPDTIFSFFCCCCCCCCYTDGTTYCEENLRRTGESSTEYTTGNSRISNEKKTKSSGNERN